jgi:hypothetical protein
MYFIIEQWMGRDGTSENVVRWNGDLREKLLKYFTDISSDVENKREELINDESYDKFFGPALDSIAEEWSNHDIKYLKTLGAPALIQFINEFLEKTKKNRNRVTLGDEYFMIGISVLVGDIITENSSF